MDFFPKKFFCFLSALFKISFTLFLFFGFLQAKAERTLRVNHYYYEILGVDAKDSSEKIKDSYEKSIKNLEARRSFFGRVFRSSESNSEINERIIEVNLAYEILSDPESRKLYDEFLRLKNLNFYEKLGLSSSASQEEIKKAHRRLSSKFHPDKWHRAGETAMRVANEVFKEILTAYKTLSNAIAKAAYDRSLAQGGSYEEGEQSSFRESSRGWSSNQINQKIFSEFLYKETLIGTLEGRVKILILGESSIISKEIKGTLWNIPNGQGGYEIVLTRASDNQHFRFREASGQLYMEAIGEIIPPGGQRPLLSLILRQNFEHHIELIQRIESIDGLRSDNSRVNVKFDAGEGAGPRSHPAGFDLGTGALKSLKIQHPDGQVQETKYDIDGEETSRKNYSKSTHTSSSSNAKTGETERLRDRAEGQKEPPRSSARGSSHGATEEISSARAAGQESSRVGGAESLSRAVYSPGSLDWQKVDQLLFRNMTVHPPKNQEGIMRQIRNLPATTLMFYAAMGASMFLPSVVGHVMYDGQPHSPTPLSDFTEMVSTPMGLISFAAFVVVSGGVGLGVSKASRFYNHHFEKKALQTRVKLKAMNAGGLPLSSAMEPDLKRLEAHRQAVIRNIKSLGLMRLPMALSAGLIASSIVYEFGADPNVKACTEGMRDKNRNSINVNDWLFACDKAYSDWAVSKKLKQWGPGLAALVGVAAGMHYAGSKIKPSMVRAIENTKAGKSSFSRFTGFVMKHQGKRWFNTLVLRTPGTIFGVVSLTTLLYILHEVDPVIQQMLQPGKSADEIAKKRFQISEYVNYYKNGDKDSNPLTFDTAIPDHCIFMTKICEHSSGTGQCDSSSISAENSAMRSYVASSPDNKFSLLSFAAGPFSYDDELAQCPNRKLIKTIHDHSGTASGWRIFSQQKFHQSYNGWIKKSFQAYTQYVLAYDFFKMLNDIDDEGKEFKTAHPLYGISINNNDVTENSLDGVKEAVGAAIYQINIFLSESESEEIQPMGVPKSLISAHPDEYLKQDIKLPLEHEPILKSIEELLKAVYCKNPIENYYSTHQIRQNQNSNALPENSENLSGEEIKCLSEESLRVKAVAAGVELLNKALKQVRDRIKAASHYTPEISLFSFLSEWLWPIEGPLALAEEQLGDLRIILGGDPRPHSRGMKFIYEQAEVRKLFSDSSFSFYNPLIDVSSQSQDPYKKILHDMVCGKDLNNFNLSSTEEEINQAVQNGENQDEDAWIEHLPLFEKGRMGHYKFSAPQWVQGDNHLPEGFCGLSPNQAFKVKITVNEKSYANLLHYILDNGDKSKNLDWWGKKVQSQFYLFHKLTQKSFGRMLKYYLKPAIVDDTDVIGVYDSNGGFTAPGEGAAALYNESYAVKMPRGILKNIEDEVQYLVDFLASVYEGADTHQKVKRIEAGISITANKKDVILFLESLLLNRFNEKSEETKQVINNMIDLEINEELEIPSLVSNSSEEEESESGLRFGSYWDEQMLISLSHIGLKEKWEASFNEEEGEIKTHTPSGVQKVIEAIAEVRTKAELSQQTKYLDFLSESKRQEYEEQVKFNRSLMEGFKFLASSANLTPEEYNNREWKVLLCLNPSDAQHCNPTSLEEEEFKNLFSLRDHALIAVSYRFQKIFQELQSYLDQVKIFSGIYLQQQQSNREN